MTLVLGVALLGGLGAALRYVIDTLITRRIGRRLPWGTMCVNALGSLLVGIVVGFNIRGNLSTHAVALTSLGFLGGFTTASTLSVEAGQLLAAREWVGSIAATAGTMAVSLGLGVAATSLIA